MTLHEPSAPPLWALTPTEAVRRVSGSIRAGGFAGGVAVTLATNVALMALTLISGTLSARLLGPAGRGELASIQLWASLGLTFGVFGLPAALTYFAARDETKAGSYFFTAIVTALAISPVIVGVCYALMPWLLSSQSAATVSEARLYLAFIPLGVVTGFCVAAIQGAATLTAWNGLRLTAGIAWMLVLVAAAFAQVSSPAMLARAFLVVVAITGVWFLIVVRRELRGSFRFDGRLLAPLYRYAVPSSLATLPQQSVLRVDQMLIAGMLDARALGLYVIAATWSGALSPISASLASAVLPHVARLQHQPDQLDALGRVSRVNVIVNVLLLVPMLLFTPLAIRILFGTQFRDSVGIALILCVAAALTSVKGVIADGLRGLGRPAAVMRGELLGFALMALILFLMLERGGLVTAAMASVAGALVTCGFLVAYAYVVYRVGGGTLLIPNRTDWTALWERIRVLAR